MILMEYMPASMPDSALHTSVTADVIEMIFDGNMFGIGVGEHAFTSVFRAYASEASSGATQPMSIWLQILCWSGIFGLVAFIVFLVFLLKRSLGFFITSDNREQRAKALALFTGLVASLLLGFTYGIWMDVRVLYLFWTCTGLLMGYIRLGNERDEIRDAVFKDLDEAKDVTVVFYD